MLVRRVARVAASTLAAVLLGVAGLGGGLWLAARSSDDEAADQLVAAGDPGMVHVHGLAVDAADGQLFAATHTGVFRFEDGEPVRVGDRRQDTMGFTAARGRFLASGHPDLRDAELRVDGKPPLLGLVESTDGARTWKPLSLLGDADLHAIAVAEEVIVAYDSTRENVVESIDGGRTWETRSTVALVDLSLDPAGADAVAAATPEGEVLSSSDGAGNWTPDPAAPPRVTVLRWARDGIWAGTATGVLARRDERGTWQEHHRFAGAVEALLIDRSTIYAAVTGEGILRSDDGAATWTPIAEQPDGGGAGTTSVRSARSVGGQAR